MYVILFYVGITSEFRTTLLSTVVYIFKAQTSNLPSPVILTDDIFKQFFICIENYFM